MADESKEKQETVGKVETLQIEVDITAGIMKDNLLRVIEREEKLEDLVESAEHLKEQGEMFAKTSENLKTKKQREVTRMKIGMISVCAGGTVLALLVLILLLVFVF